MRVAFTGKGGSGKSTLTALFVRYLAQRGKRVLAVDADINVHLGDLLEVPTTPERALSREDNVRAIRTHLKGSNPLVGDVESFVKSTPPGPGSRLIHLDDDDLVIARWSVPTPSGARLAHVGTYEAASIGTACYHTNLAILENLLSHLVLRDGEWVVCDMVAGTDAFSNTLHAQFDRILVVVEPTPESAAVAARYLELARAAGVADAVGLVGNKIESDDDRRWLAATVGQELLGQVGFVTGLKRARRTGRAPGPHDLDDLTALEAMESAARAGGLALDARARLLRALHLKIADQNWVRASYGDLTSQLVPEP